MRHLFLKAGICLSVLNLIVFVPAVMAGGTIEFGDNQSISIGAGLRAGFTRVEDAAPSGTDASSNFNIQSMRLYVNGQVNDKVKFTFNTECEGCVFGQDDNDPIGAAGDIGVLDAIVRLEFSTAFNVWAGRMLTPADRIEMNGPYYGLSWNQYTVPLLPSDQLGQAGLLGRDDGVTIWGSTGKLQYAAGLFDGVDGGPNQDDNLLFSGRLAYHFLDMEQNPGYYTSSTYYGGGGDIFTVALTYQSQTNGTGTAAEPGDFDATIIDVLFEKAMGNGSAITIEGEYKM
ncbi:MAG: porin, partial [Pseudomonadota bacterium]|nr:porin [Pseudomonadota bacterium]